LTKDADLFASFADPCGTGVSTYQDGISLKPLLTDANAIKRTYVYSEQFGNNPSTNDGYAIRNTSYKLIHLQSGTEYFYKISSDPFEQVNLLLNPLTVEAQQNLDQLRVIQAGL